jgi:hypothetical protein
MPGNDITDVIQYVVTLVTGQYQYVPNLKTFFSVEACGKVVLSNRPSAFSLWRTSAASAIFGEDFQDISPAMWPRMVAVWMLIARVLSASGRRQKCAKMR